MVSFGASRTAAAAGFFVVCVFLISGAHATMALALVARNGNFLLLEEEGHKGKEDTVREVKEGSGEADGCGGSSGK